MKHLVFLLLSLYCTVVVADFSDASAELERLRVNAVDNPTKQNEFAYLDHFPSTYEEYHFTFYGHKCCEELYHKAMQHLELINTLSEKYPDKVLELRLDVATNGHWRADAVGFWQHELVNYAATETIKFANALNKRSLTQRKSIVRFLADIENHKAYKSYSIASQKLKDLGYESLHELFEAEKARRMAIKDH